VAPQQHLLGLRIIFGQYAHHHLVLRPPLSLQICSWTKPAVGAGLKCHSQQQLYIETTEVQRMHTSRQVATFWLELMQPTMPGSPQISKAAKTIARPDIEIGPIK